MNVEKCCYFLVFVPLAVLLVLSAAVTALLLAIIVGWQWCFEEVIHEPQASSVPVSGSRAVGRS